MSAALKMSALERAKEEAWSTPLDKLDVSKAERFASNTHWPFFERLRKEAPVHYCAESMHGAYWSITKFNDIVAVDSNHRQFSSSTTSSSATIRQTSRRPCSSPKIRPSMTCSAMP